MKSYIRPLGIIVVSLFGFLVIVSFYVERSAFQLTARELHQKALHNDYAVSMSMVNKMEDPLLIDIRSTQDFQRSHLDGAVNAPMKTLLNDGHLDVFNTLRKKVIVSDDPMNAHETWMLLTQLDIDELYVLEE